MDDFQEKEYNCSLCEYATTDATEYMKHWYMAHDGILEEWQSHYGNKDSAAQTIGMLGL